jgi:hypothetical protein
MVSAYWSQITLVVMRIIATPAVTRPKSAQAQR